MRSKINLVLLPPVVVSIFFMAYAIYFAIFNQYHLAYQEQIQLFRFDWSYFSDFLTRPGGFSLYLGAFFTQFYVIPFAAALIVTLAGIALWYLTTSILRKYNITGIMLTFIPVFFLIALQSKQNYNLGLTCGLLLNLTFITIYISIGTANLRYITGVLGFIILYLATGVFFFLSVLLCIIHELLFVRGQYRLLITPAYFFLTALIPWLSWKYIFLVPFADVWLSPLQAHELMTMKYELLLLLIYFPLILLAVKAWFALSKKTHLHFGWNWKTILAGTIAFLTLTWGIKKYAYDPNTEILLGMDYHIHHSEWNEVLKLSPRYTGTNRVTTYFTNLALYKTGQLGDQMFHYNQPGIQGLWLDWAGMGFSYFFGGEIFYHLGFINEAYRWAYDTMVTLGKSPRLMKRLVLVSLINENEANAEKYLSILNETLFYRKWAQNYLRYLEDPDLVLRDNEINDKRNLVIHSDFIVSSIYPDSVLIQLLKNHPHNQMAFEYYMAALLLDNNITAFAANLYHLKEFGYKDIPVHFEEALLLYMFMAEKNIIPEGYTIRESTNQHFMNYIKTHFSYSSNPELAAKALGKQYGKTYWFYLHFLNNQVKVR